MPLPCRRLAIAAAAGSVTIVVSNASAASGAITFAGTMVHVVAFLDFTATEDFTATVVSTIASVTSTGTNFTKQQLLT